ncbi:MAG: aldehyde dehydrogenase family protein, partial [Bacteroidota bacterium]
MADTISTFHCRTNSVNGSSYAITTPAELLHALASADHAHASGIWQKIEIREAFFPLLIKEIERNKAPLQEVYCAETSLSPARFEREFQRMLQQIVSYGREGIALAKRTETTVLIDKTLTKKWMPVGPVVVFGASNFPLAYGTLGGDTIGALAAGCPVIVKGHPFHAGTSTLLLNVVSHVLNDLKLPGGVFSHVLDEGYLAGQQLIMDERIKACAFTGSMNGGLSLYRLAQQRKIPVPFFAEMG